MKLYTILKDGKFIKSEVPGEYAGYNGKKKSRRIFGRLDCASGKRLIKKENRVFFHTLEDAVQEGYRPCKHCKPLNENNFQDIKHLTPYKTLKEFYNRDD
jgi:hypothetical protein|tara:strand:- start:188 stop:487 length:300 start_codon:yes stop_codon:yes gene_type:complete